jgi:carbamoyltransferase
LEIELVNDTSFPFSDVRNHTSQIEKWISSEFKSLENRDLAFGMQTFYEDFILNYIEKAKTKFGGSNLCVAGGGFANVKLNKRIFESRLFEGFHIFPAMGDDGAALGALILGHLESEVDVSWLREVRMPFFGPEATEHDIADALKSSEYPIKFEKVGEQIPAMLALDLHQGKLCALFQGKMEYGPRALGHRSILANPLLPEIKNELNLKFKKREWFQPFCPSILDIEQERLFESAYQNRHMTCAFQLKEEFVEKLPGIAHVDGTARAEFLNSEDDPTFYKVIQQFKELTGFGVLLNTSFNIHGKTIVLTPSDALDDFMSCSIDVLYIGNYRVTRTTKV